MKQMPPLDTKDNPHVFDSIRYLWNHFTLRRKAEFSVILVLTLITSVLEVIGIGLVLPFLAILNNPIDGLNHEYVYPIVQYLGITNSDNFINMFAMIFIIAIAIAAFFRLLLLYLITKLSYSAGGDIGVEIYRRTLYQDFSVHMLRNSSEIINGIVLKSNIAIGTIQSVLMLLSSIIMLTIVLGTLVSINPEIAILLLFGFMSFYWLVSFYTRRSIKSNSELISKNSNGIIKIIIVRNIVK